MNRAKIKFLHHKNGHGKIFDNAEACPASFIDKTSELLGERCSVFDSVIKDSEIKDSLVVRCVVEESSLLKNTKAIGTRLTHCFIEGELIATKGTMENSVILEASRVTGQARCSNVEFKNLTVWGKAVLLDWKQPTGEVFDGLRGYISRGVWRRPPRVIRLDCDLTLTESVPGFAWVGCYERSLDDWFKFGDKLGETFGITPEDVEQIRMFFKSLSSD